LDNDLVYLNAALADHYAAEHKRRTSLGCEGGVISAPQFDRKRIIIMGIIEEQRARAA
jgi:hypothetical protein